MPPSDISPCAYFTFSVASERKVRPCGSKDNVGDVFVNSSGTEPVAFAFVVTVIVLACINAPAGIVRVQLPLGSLIVPPAAPICALVWYGVDPPLPEPVPEPLSLPDFLQNENSSPAANMIDRRCIFPPHAED